MAFDNHVNLLIGTVKIAPSPSSTGETLTLMPGDAARFKPNMPVTLFAPDVSLPSHDNAEIAYVREVNGDVLTLTRGTEGTHKLQVRFGWRVVGSSTAKTIEDLEAAIVLKLDAADLPDISGKADTTYVDAQDAAEQAEREAADTALQVEIDEKYELPVSGVERSDLDASTRASLTKADTALQVAPVTSVSGKTGAVTVTKGDVGLPLAENTADLDKPVSTAQAAINATKVDRVAGKGLSTNDYVTADRDKLAGIAPGATQNASNEALRERTTHTGTQAVSTVTGLQAALDGKVQLGGDLGGTVTTPTLKNSAKVFNIKDYGAIGDGLVDDTVAINSAINAAYVNGGGTVYVPSTQGKYRCDGAIAFPYGGGYFTAVQPPIKVVGDGANWNGRWTSLFVGTGSILELRYTGADELHPAKIDTRGAGYLEFDGITFASGPDDFPFFQTTNTTVFVHNCAVQGNPTKSGPNCVQDFMHFGGETKGLVEQSGLIVSGTGTAFTPDMVGATIAYNGLASSTKSVVVSYISPTQLTVATNQTITSRTWGISTPCNIAISPFQGYGSKLENNYYGRINRGSLFGNYTNNICIQNETFSTSCGSTDREFGAPYVMAPSFSSVGGNTISHATIEAGSYPYGVALVGAGFTYTNNIDFIGMYDDHGSTFGAVYCGPNAYYNQITTGWFNTSLQPNYVAGPNKIFQNVTSASQNMPNYSYVGYWSNNYIAKNITSVNPDLPLGTTMTVDTGTGGSNLNLKANTHQIMSKDGVVMSSFKNSASAKGVYQMAGGITSDRPSAVSVGAGSIWFDTLIGRIIVSDGVKWVVLPDDSRVVHNDGDTITIPVGGNAPTLTFRQNDTVNNPRGLLLVQAAANTGFEISQQGNGQALRIVHNDSASGGNLSSIDVIRTSNSATLTRGISVSVTNNGTGGTSVASFTGGPLTMGSQKITGVANPTNAQDAATKSYVDGGFVDLTTAQVVGGNKSFSGSAIRIGSAGAATSSLQVSGSFALTPTASQSSTYSFGANDNFVPFNITAAATATLPNATTCDGREIEAILTSTGFSLTIATSSSQTINGAATYVLSAQWKYVRVKSVGGQWLVMGNN